MLPEQVDLRAEEAALELLVPRRHALSEELREVRETLSGDSKAIAAAESNVRAAKAAADAARSHEEDVSKQFAAVDKRDVKLKEDKKHLTAQVRTRYPTG